MRTTIPAALETVISPTVPSSDGSRIIRLLPNSSTVVVKSVPRTAMVAEGVLSAMFGLAILPEPDVNLAVPDANRSAILDADGLPL